VVVRTLLNVPLYAHCLSYLQLQYQLLEAKSFLEKVTAAQVITKFSFYETWTFITVFTKVCHFNIWAGLIKKTVSKL